MASRPSAMLTANVDLGVICKLAEGALDLAAYVTDELECTLSEVSPA